MTNVGLIGYAGRMGKAVEAYLADKRDLKITARLEQGESLAQFIAAKPDLVIDFSLGPAVEEHGLKIAEAGLPYIIGASGLNPGTFEAFEKVTLKTGTAVLVVPNFSLGANLMIKFAVAAARYMNYPVITERHHEKKLDAPSGTARYTARQISAALKETSPAGDQPVFSEQIAGVIGGSDEGVALHSIRGSGYLAEQQVLFTLAGESLALEHRSIDRRCFMPGVEYAIRNIGKVNGLVIGLDTILEM